MRIKDEITESCSDAKRHKFRLFIYSQHLPFAAKCFSKFIERLHLEQYDVGFIETNTRDVISSIINGSAEAGVIVTNDFNKGLIMETAARKHFTIKNLYSTMPYLYISADHPLAGMDKIRQENLADYPCIYLDQNIHLIPVLSSGLVSDPKIGMNIFVNDRLSAFMMLRLNQAYCIGTGRLTDFEGIFNAQNDTVKVVSLDTPYRIQVQAIYREDEISEAAEEYLCLLKKELSRDD